jgi:eukaryotic-like serine/threonine-protein kinase
VSGLKLLGSDSELPPRIDRYELIAEIASGGMASVYLARLLGVGGFQRFFAVKRMHPHLDSEEGFVEMFLDEARLVANIRHPNVVPVLEVGEGKSGHYLVMEYIEGDTLGRVIRGLRHKKKQLPAPVAVRVMLDTLAGLHAAHELRDADGQAIGLVHRDVSPQNILVDIEGMVRISDFGVAHATSRLSSTRSGQLKGKVAYMAPEQARCEKVTRRADVFAAAIVLWETLTHKRLFMADNEAVTLSNLLFEPIAKLRQVDPSLPEGLEAVVAKALDRDIEKRFATAAEFAEALERAARSSDTLASPAETKACVSEAIGEDIAQRRDQIRGHLAVMDRRKLEVSGAQHALIPPVDVEEPVAAPTSSEYPAAMAVTAPAGHRTTRPDQPLPAIEPDPLPAPLRSRRSVLIGVSGAAFVFALFGAYLVLRAVPPAAVTLQSAAGASRSDLPQGSSGSSAAANSDTASLAFSPSASAAADTTPGHGKTGGPRRFIPPAARSAQTGAPARTEQPNATQATTPAAPAPNPAHVAPPSATDDLTKNPYR